MAITKEITIPSSASEIPMSRYMKYAALTNGELFDFHLLVSVLSGCTIEEAKLIKAKDVGRAVNSLVSALNDTKSHLMHTYSHQGVEYGFEPVLDDMPWGMMVDLCTFFEAPETWHKVLAVLYRPIVRTSSSFGGIYAIEKHDALSDSYKQRQQMFLEAPASLFIGVRAFFLTGSMRLEIFTQGFLDRPSKRQLRKMRKKQKG